jgi:hypothetical protein
VHRTDREMETLKEAVAGSDSLNTEPFETKANKRYSFLVDKSFSAGLTESETNEKARLYAALDALDYHNPPNKKIRDELAKIQQELSQERLSKGLELSHFCAPRDYNITTNKCMAAINAEISWSTEHRVWVAGHEEGEDEDLIIFKFCPFCGVRLAKIYSPPTEAETATTPQDSEAKAEAVALLPCLGCDKVPTQYNFYGIHESPLGKYNAEVVCKLCPATMGEGDSDAEAMKEALTKWNQANKPVADSDSTKPSTEALAPCPRCASPNAASIETDKSQYRISTYIRCKVCGYPIGSEAEYTHENYEVIAAEQRAELIEAWNIESENPRLAVVYWMTEAEKLRNENFDLRHKTQQAFGAIDATVTPPTNEQKVSFWDSLNKLWIDGMWIKIDNQQENIYYAFATKDRNEKYSAIYLLDRAWLYQAPQAPPLIKESNEVRNV